jgi:hypothetical protein
MEWREQTSVSCMDAFEETKRWIEVWNHFLFSCVLHFIDYQLAWFHFTHYGDAAMTPVRAGPSVIGVRENCANNLSCYHSLGLNCLVAKGVAIQPYPIKNTLGSSFGQVIKHKCSANQS